MHGQASRASAMLLAVFLLVPWPFPGTGGIQASSFAGGAKELVISFPPGGGTNTSVNLTMPAGATVLSAVMDITGMPIVSNGSLDYSTPQKLMAVPSSINLTVGAQGAALASFNWSRVQASDAEFRTDEGANISVGQGVRISDAIIGGTSHPFTVVSGRRIFGIPSVNCTPDGNIITAGGWGNLNGSYAWCFQKFNPSGQKIGPEIKKGTDGPNEGMMPRAVSDLSGGTVFVWQYFEQLHAAIFDNSGNQIGPDINKGPSFVGSAVVTGPDEFLITQFLSNNSLYGYWYHLNGTPIGDKVFIEDTRTNDLFSYGSPVISVGDDKSILFAGTAANWSASHYQAYAIRRDSTGALVHDRVFVGGNNSYTATTSTAILDDGTSVVAYTANYTGHDLEVRCARLAANGTILGQYIIANTSETDCFSPSLCRLPGNRFACAWGRSSGGSAIDLQGRVFRADGTPEGAIFSMGNAYGVNASWELCARGNSSLALVVRSDDPSPYGSIRVEVVELQRALKGHIDSPVLDRPGTVVTDVRLAPGTSYSVDVLDAVTHNATIFGLHNGDAVRNWSTYILRLNLERAAFNASVSEPAVLQFGVATRICDFFEDRALVSVTDSVNISSGRAILRDGAPNGSLSSTEIMLPFRAASLDNLSWAPDKGILPILASRGWGGGWNPSEGIGSPGKPLSIPTGDAVKWTLLFVTSSSFRPEVDTLILSYSLRHKTGFLLSAPVNLTDGTFSRYRVNWTSSGEGTVRALVTTDGGMTYDEAANGTWNAAAGPGRTLQAMLVLEGDGNQSPRLSGFWVDYEAQSLPSDLSLEIDRSYRWSPPEGSDLEKGLEVRDFSSPLNAVLRRHPGGGDISIPLNFSSATAGLLRLSNLRLVLNLPPVIEAFSPQNDTVLEQGATQHFAVDAYDPDADALEICWTVDGVPAGAGASFDYAAPDSSGNHTVSATVSDGKASAVHSWNVSVIFIDRNRPPAIQSRFPANDPVINETETQNFSVLASDPDAQPLRFSWYVDGEKVSTSDNLTWRTWYNSSGVHAVSVTVSDGAKSASTGWNLTVLNVNRPPIITDWHPEGPLACGPGAQIEFGINVSDPDGEAVNISWSIDGKPVGNATSLNFTLVAPWSDGRAHTVRAAASDGNLSASHEWHVRSIIPDETSRLNVSDPWCIAGAAIVAVMIAAVVLVRLRNRDTR